MSIKLTKIKRTVTESVPVGAWLVSFEQIWGTPCNPGQHDDCLKHGCMDNEPDRVSDVEPSVQRVTRDNYMSLPGDVRNQSESWNDDNRVCGDTHDLRPRLFKTQKEAKQHAEYTVKRFRNPQPWECFVQAS